MGDLFEDYVAGSAWGLAVGERHAVVGRERDYADVPPIEGVHSTGTPEFLEVDVPITRLA